MVAHADLVAHYEFDNSANLSEDSSGLGNDLNIYTSGLGFKDGAWHHVAATCDEVSNVRTLYYDGAEIGSDNPATGHNMQAMNFSVGGTRVNRNAGTSPVQSFEGVLDDVRVYDTALSATEIETLASVPELSTLVLLVCGCLVALVSARQTCR